MHCHLLTLAAALTAAVNGLYIGERSTEQLYHLELSPGETKYVTEAEKFALIRQNIKFMDITNNEDLASIGAKNFGILAATFPATLTQSTAVKALIPKLSAANAKAFVTTFSAYNNRYYKSTTGTQSSAWLLQQVQSLITASGAKNVTAKAFTHTWNQPSIIATIPGLSTKTIVVGAHQDSINGQNPTNGRAPGADDDGSGSATVLEAFRVLLTDPKVITNQLANTLEFHWYSAEEGGLLGSQAIFQQYATQGRLIKAMLEQDMTGYSAGTTSSGGQENMGVMTDYVDLNLTAFLKKVITAYCAIPYVETKCGYACSDHASATKAGYPSALITEAAFEKTSQVIHTANDVISTVNFDHVIEFSKMVVGYLYELGSATTL